MNKEIILTGIIKCNDDFLIVKRSSDDNFLPGVWEFPGGHLEDGEILLEGLKRELFEEVGIEFELSNSKIVNFYDQIKKKKYKLEIDFLIELNNKNLKIKLSSEHEDYKWIKKDSILIDDFIRNKIKDL